MTGNESAEFSIWSREQDKKFESGLATYPESSEDRWEKIAADIPGKSIEDVKKHYDILVDDIERIESGCVPLPGYKFSLDAFTVVVDDEETGKKAGNISQLSADSGKASRPEQERRKGTPWTEDEHRQFLLGLEKYGKGDWRSISRNFVVTRTPTQVASHAQKYFIRLNSINNDRRRTSIHDITNAKNRDAPVPQGPITGHTNGSPGESSGTKPCKQVFQSPAASSRVGQYGRTTMGQTVGGQLISAAGTLVNLPQPTHTAFGWRAPVPGQMVPGPPVNMGSMAYPMPPTHCLTENKYKER
ncbi:Transcription factor DIVARICATA [Heracleum sosnowskyi]|uniref:Transcription factor DIVARICATA n=1 Tax=Heracleum sosnowskyi TaxID=360622 RepID=A0AAD8MW59_9APIA|nr:Transcription factor DIVARICATA [Heracleum sosnowskyi]